MLAGAALAVGGCGLGAPAGTGDGRILTAPDESPTRGEVTGDWEDLGAAVWVCASQSEVASMGVTDRAPGRVRYAIRSAMEEEGYLEIATAADPGSLDEVAVPMVLEVRVGRFGRPAHERRFVSALLRRLSRLRGVEYAR